MIRAINPHGAMALRKSSLRSIRPVFGSLFADEPVPENGRLTLSDRSGFGMKLNPEIILEELV